MVSDKFTKCRKVGGLTPKQQLFVKEYLVDLNATQAAIRAGFSKKTAREQAYRMFTNVHIEQAIKEDLERKFSKTDRLSDKVIDELIKIATADIKDFLKFNKDGVVLYDSDDVDGTMINEIVSETIENESGSNRRTKVRIKLHDKLKALEMLGRYLNLWKTDKDEDNAEKTINNINTVVYQIVRTPEQIEAEK